MGVNMDKKYILIIIVIALVLVVAGLLIFNFHTTEEVQYKNLNLSTTCTVSVPLCNKSTFTEDDGIKTYNATNLTIITYNKNDLNQWENLGADIGLNGALNQNFKYNHSHNGKNILIHPDDNKTVYACLISNNTTGDVVIVATPDEKVLYHIIDTINFTANEVNISQNTSDNAVQDAGDKTSSVSKNSTEKTSTKSAEYEEGYIAENDQDIDYDGDGVGDGSAYHSHEYYVEHGQTKPVPLGGK